MSDCLHDRLRNFEKLSIITRQYTNLLKISHALRSALIALLLSEKQDPMVFTLRGQRAQPVIIPI